jgi:hypothetical protein
MRLKNGRLALALLGAIVSRCCPHITAAKDLKRRFPSQKTGEKTFGCSE